MLRILFVLLLFSFAFADINKTIIYDNNVTLYRTLASELNTSDPAYKLQKTLIEKITQILAQKQQSLFSFRAQDQESFIRKFMEFNALLAQTKRAQKEIEKLNDQLNDIKEDLERNATLTTQLEYAYYYKLRQQKSAFITAVQKNRDAWLKRFLHALDALTFKSDAKALAKAQKDLKAIDAKLKKYSIELERWKILQNEQKIAYLQKLIDRYEAKKRRVAKRIIALRLQEFFAALKAKDPKALQIAQDITDFIAQELNDLRLAASYQESFALLLAERIGNTKTKLLQLKSQIVTFMQSNTFLGMPLYKFAEALGIFLLFLLFRKIFALIVIAALKKATSFTATTIDDKILQVLEGPLKFAFIILGLYIAFFVAGVSNPFVDQLIKSLVIFLIFWLLYNSVIVLDESIYRFARKFGKELYREIGAFFIKTLKIFIVAIGLVSILQVWDINVSAFLASLGLGGLAFALAAKDTAANLFGGLSILADRALKIDDWIKVGGVEGTVEDIGLRTTKIRTFEKSLVTVPNQIIANNPIENFSRRNIRRIKMRVGLVYSTTHEQMKAILNDIRNMLQSHPGIAQDATLLVNFDEFEDSSLSIFIYCFTNTAEWAKYLAIKEDVNLKIMEIVQRHGSDFAFPSESIYIEKLPKNEADEKDSDNW